MMSFFGKAKKSAKTPLPSARPSTAGGASAGKPGVDKTKTPGFSGGNREYVPRERRLSPPAVPLAMVAAQPPNH